MKTWLIFSLSLTTTAFIFNLYVIYLIYFASPKSIQSYKYYLLSVAIFDNAYIFVADVLLPDWLVPLAGIEIVGELGAEFGEKIARYMLLLTGLLCGDIVLAVTACIVYRYITVFANPKYVDVFNQKRGALVIVCVFLVADGGFAVLGWLCYIPQDEFLEYLRVTPGGEEVLAKMHQGAVVVGVGADPIRHPMKPLYAYMLCWVVFVFAIDVFCVFRVRRHLRYSAANWSAKTRHLHLQFLTALAFQAFYPFVTLLFPQTCVLILKRIIPDTLTETSSRILIAFFFSNMPLMNCLSTVVCVKPYRVFTLQLLTRFARYTILRVIAKCNKQSISLPATPTVGISSSAWSS